MKRRVRWEIWLTSLLCSVVALGVTTFIVTDCNGKRRCESSGGSVQIYDCRSTLMCTGSGCVPMRHCKWQCVGAPAERR